MRPLSSLKGTRVMGLVLALLAILCCASTAQEAERITLDARQELKTLEATGATLKVGDKNGARRLLQRLKIVKSKLSSARDKKHPDWVDAATRFNALQTSVTEKANGTAARPEGTPDPAVLDALRRDADAALRELKPNLVSAFADPAFVEKWKSIALGLRRRHTTLPQDDRGVKNVGVTISSLENMIASGTAALGTNTRQAELNAEMQAMMKSYELPPRLSVPLDPAHVEECTKSVVEMMGPRIRSHLARLEEMAKDPAVDTQKLSSARFWIADNGKRNLQEWLNHSAMIIDGLVDERFAQFILETDPTNENHVSNRLLAEGSFDSNMTSLRKSLHTVEVGVVFDRCIARKNGPDRAAQRTKLEAAIAHLEKVAVQALHLVRMPETRSTDSKLLAVAEEVLKNPRHGVQGWKRMVVSYDLHRREKHQGTITHGTTSSTLTSYHYVWDEFGTTTAEKVGDTWYLFANKFKRYEKGDTRTPLEKWILVDRFQTTRILEENIAK